MFAAIFVALHDLLKQMQGWADTAFFRNFFHLSPRETTHGKPCSIRRVGERLHGLAYDHVSMARETCY